MDENPNIKIRAVLFDYGMVLCDMPEAQSWQRLESILDVEPERFETLYWRYRDAYDRGLLGARTYWETVAREVDKPLDEQTLQALMDADVVAWTRPNVPMMEWAERLNRAGIKTGILSNIGDAMEAGILRHFPALAEFSHHTFSHRLGIAKPDPGSSQQAGGGLGVGAGGILFVDDKEENILAARAAGMVGVQYTSHEAFLEVMERMGLGWLLRL
ncbi:MAG: HAD family phosphatase [Acidobacteriaceae bacterium]